MSKPRVLVVDDEASIRRAIELVLESQYEVVPAATFEEGLRHVHHNGNFDAALVDKNLPDGNGIELIRAIHERKPSMPVILITGYPTLESAIEAVEQGAFDYVLKPFDTADLRHKVHRAVQHNLLEAKLRHAERLETVGRFASSIAHDFNNLLTVFSTNSELVGDFLRRHADQVPVDDALEDIDAIAHACESAAALTRQLLTFSGQRQVTPQPTSIDDVIEQLHRTMLRTLAAAVEIDLDLDRALPPVMVDPGEFEQVLLNLVLNARDAMPAGGKICIRTACTDEGVQITVEDNGAGMDAETVRHIFEPFFTTKEDRGTGLGLASTRRVVEAVGGTVSVSSEVGVGTTFVIHLPRFRRSSRPPPPMAASSTPG